MIWIMVALISGTSGIIIAKILAGAMEHQRTCANTECKYHGSNGACYHRCSAIDADGKCASFEESEY